MSHLRNISSSKLRLETVSPEQKGKDAEFLVQELQSLELLPLIQDIVEDVNSGRLLPKDADNAAGTIKIKINNARTILRNIHGLSETPEERALRVQRLTNNISSKKKSLNKFKEMVAKRLDLSKDRKE